MMNQRMKSSTRKILVVKDPKIRLVNKKTKERSRYEKLLDSIYDAVLVTDPEGYVTEVNARAVEMFEFTWDEFPGVHIGSVVEKADQRLLRTLKKNIDDKRYTVLEGRCYRKDRSSFAAEVAVGAELLESDTGLMFFVRNITPRKEAEHLLRAANNALMNAAIGMVITDPDGLIETANPAFLKAWGYPEDANVQNLPLHNFFDNRQEIEDIVHKVQTSLISMDETRAKKADGATFYVQLSAAPNLSGNSQMTGIVFSMRDNTAAIEAQNVMKDAARQKIEAERIQARMDTIRTLGYALNNPLQTLLSMAEMDQREDYKEQVHRMISIVQELQSSEPLKVIKSPDGVERYKLNTAAHLTPCAPQTVLIVDDEELIIKHFNNFLNSKYPDASVDIAHTGKKALERFGERHHRLILLDCVMPGMTGEETYAELEKMCEERDWQMPNVIFCTGFMPPEPIRELTESGKGHHLLTKPISRDDLTNAIGSFLQNPRGG